MDLHSFVLLIYISLRKSTVNSLIPSSFLILANFQFCLDWGMELMPRILGFDVKMFTNCRTGMMFWAVGIICFAHKNMELNDGVLSIGMAVNVILQLVYITKFFYWEMGYMCSMDIQHDRAGYYICWGCKWQWKIYMYTHISVHSNCIQEMYLTSDNIFHNCFRFGLGTKCLHKSQLLLGCKCTWYQYINCITYFPIWSDNGIHQLWFR